MQQLVINATLTDSCANPPSDATTTLQNNNWFDVKANKLFFSIGSKFKSWGFDFEAVSDIPAGAVVGYALSSLPAGLTALANTISASGYNVVLGTNDITFVDAIPAGTGFSVSGIYTGTIPTGTTIMLTLSGDYNLANNTTLFSN